MFIDFFEPGFFAKPYGLYYIAGRASGIFMNANTAGTGLLIGLIFSIDIVKKKWRFLVLMFVFLGVTLTFSRASILAYLLIIIILTIQKKIELRKVLLMFVIFIFSITSFLTFGIDYLAQNDINTKNIENRVIFIKSGGQSEKDESQQIREYVFKKALNMFEDKPIFGNGYASTKLWDWPESTHNLFVSNWADYGFFGVILIPLLMFFLLRNSKGDTRTIISLFIFIFMFRSLFTHNSLDIYYFITSISLAMAMNIKSREGYIK
jgi:O-antigen ligase